MIIFPWTIRCTCRMSKHDYGMITKIPFLDSLQMQNKMHRTIKSMIMQNDLNYVPTILVIDSVPIFRCSNAFSKWSRSYTSCKCRTHWIQPERVPGATCTFWERKEVYQSTDIGLQYSQHSDKAEQTSSSGMSSWRNLQAVEEEMTTNSAGVDRSHNHLEKKMIAVEVVSFYKIQFPLC